MIFNQTQGRTERAGMGDLSFLSVQQNHVQKGNGNPAR